MTNNNYIRTYKIWSFWIALATVLLVLVASGLDWVSLSMYQVLGAAVAFIAGDVAIEAILTGRIFTRVGDVFVTKTPKFFWFQVGLLVALSIAGIVVSIYSSHWFFN